MKSWTQKQIRQHEVAGEKLGLIKDEVRDFIIKNHKNISEIDCIKFIKNTYKKHGLVNDHKKEFAIVAFDKNTNEVHHFPLKPLPRKGSGDHSKNGLAKDLSSKLKTNDLILLDIWARLDVKNAPYADATFMFYFGRKIPTEIQNTWEVLVKSRDNAINYIKEEIRKRKFPRCLDIDRIAHDHIGNNGLGHAIKHTIGHSLGFDSPHGKLPGINWREYSPIIKNVGYTIEPGIYLEKFGMRTEIDFYINNKKEMVITTPIQKELDLIKNKK